VGKKNGGGRFRRVCVLTDFGLYFFLVATFLVESALGAAFFGAAFGAGLVAAAFVLPHPHLPAMCVLLG